jgi:hypothetical protein
MCDVKELIESPMSDGDLRKVLGNDVKIVRYSDLSSLKSLDRLLPNTTDSCILLYETQPGVGHWTALMKYNDLYELFDPYGLYPDDELNWIPKARRKLLNQNEPYLARLLKKSGKQWIYNKRRYQKMSDTVNTCGDHCVHRIYRLTHSDMDLKDYSEYMDHVRDEYKVGYDVIVAEFVESFE